MFRVGLLIIAAAQLSGLCLGAPSYTSYFNNVHIYTNATLGGVPRNSWPVSASVGTIVNSGSSSVGSAPIFSDSTGTNVLSAAGYYNVAAAGILPDGNDHTAALNTLLTNVYNAGGGTIAFNSGTYLLSGKISIPNDNGTAPRNKSLRLTGSGAFFTGQSYAPFGGTILEMPYVGTPSKIITRGLGHLELDHITFKNTTGAGNTPFIKTIYTTLSIHNCGFYGPAQGVSAVQDAIILGGIGSADFTTGGDDASFQGYGTLISDNYFNRIRSGVVANEHANGNWIQNNLFWSECGGDGGAIVLTTNNFNGSCVGNVVIGNLIEMSGYTNGITITNATASTLIGNTFYDPPAWPANAFYQTGGSGTTISAGFIDSGLTPYVAASGAGLNFYTAVSGQTNIINNLQKFNGQIYFDATAGPQFRNSAGDYVRWSVNNDGSTFQILATTDGNTNYSAFRVAKTSNNTRLTLGAVDGIIVSPTQLYLQAPTLWLGNASDQRHYINNQIFYGTRQNTTFRTPTGASYEWSGSSTASDAAAAMVTYTNGMLKVYGATRESTYVPIKATTLIASVGVGTAVTLGATNDFYALNVNAQTATLPDTAGLRGRKYEVKVIAPAETGTVATTSSQLIDGATTYSLTASNKFVVVRSDGTNWWVIGNN